MKTLLTVCCFVLFPVVLMAQDEQLATPGASPEHEVLNKDVGTWDAEISMWLPGQGDEPMVSKGTETNRMVGDFWLVSDLNYEAFGQEFGGHGLFGFDAAAGKYVGTWYSSDSPNPIPMVGEWDEATNTMTMMMDGKDASGGSIKGKTVATYTDDKHKTFEMHVDVGGDELHKMMEIKYTKK